MLDIIFQNLNAIITILTLLVAIYVYFKQKRKRNLDYKILSKSSLLEIGEEIQEDVVILYKNNPIEQVNLIEVEIKNSGNEIIEEKNFVDPIQLNFGIDSEILTYNIINKNPSNMKIHYEINKDASNYEKLFIKPRLMNSKDKFTVKLLVSKMREIQVEGRIEGVKKIRNESDFEVEFANIITPFIFLLVGIYLLYTTIFIKKTSDIKEYFLIVAVLLFGSFAVYKDSIPLIKKYILRFD